MNNSGFGSGDLAFCCQGCLSVYKIIHEHGLCDYYELGKNPGNSQKSSSSASYSISELELMAEEFEVRKTADSTTVQLHIPSLHCSSCIWLMEKLNEFDKGILKSRVDFSRKQLTVVFEDQKTSFGKIVKLLQSLGYCPSLWPEQRNDSEIKESRKALKKLGIAGFLTGNTMLFSFPQYFGLTSESNNYLNTVFLLLNLTLSLPLIFYCAWDYLKSLYTGLLYKSISVKVPLAVGICALWIRSVFEVVNNSGGGYFDSLAGLVFFLLAGEWLKNKTFDALRFGGAPKKYFPMVIRELQDGKIILKKISDLKPGNRILVRFGEIIPANGILLRSNAFVEYSFTTGESTPNEKVAGEMLYGGGRNLGDEFEMEVLKPFTDEEFNGIWGAQEIKQLNGPVKYEKSISKYFVISTVLISLATFIFWMANDSSKAWFSFIAVLMVACPCALALAPAFTFNMVTSRFAELGLYLKNTETVGDLGEITTVIFDKTGTLTDTEIMKVKFPDYIPKENLKLLYTISSQSNHPYSRAIASALNNFEKLKGTGYSEKLGLGSRMNIGKMELKLGNAKWIFGDTKVKNEFKKAVWFSINNNNIYPIIIEEKVVENGDKMINDLNSQGLKLYLASGDEESKVKHLLSRLTGKFYGVSFELTPSGKKEKVKEISQTDEVLMVGDGLNDTGALKVSRVGMVIANNTVSFLPEAKAILLKDNLQYLPDYLRISKRANRIVKEAFVLSMGYNIFAVYLAVTGQMQPVIAAIIMPLSAIVIMIYASIRTLGILKKKIKI